MDKRPASPKRRQTFEALIRVVDLVVYGAVFLAGVYAAVAAPNVVTEELGHVEWLIIPWAVLLLGGGLVGFVGRLSKRWLFEAPATVAAFFGILIYLAIVVKYVVGNVTATVAAALVLVSAAAMLRRWVELQIFGTEPDKRWQARLKAAAARRTQNVVHHT